MSNKMVFSRFSIAQLPRIEFGNGIMDKLPEWILDYGSKVLLITGNRSVAGNPIWHKLISDMADNKIQWQRAQIHDEPSPEIIDEIVHQYHTDHIDVIVGIGGGSVLDAAKAIAGLLKVEDSVMDYLEGVGPEKP